MVKLSVIIVNYNVQFFLEQCLYSAIEAAKLVETEIFVVDNCSSDDSVEMVKQKFPHVKLIASNENLGFSKGNNLAIKQSTGQYILLLNPDTVVQSDTFLKVVNFMDSHTDAGGLGVKMIDGKGEFLPESKRSLPTPLVAFYKIFGLSALFPKSKTFGKYHLGYLPNNQTHQVEVLSGAFMLIRKSIIYKIGALDETFFMYGEDIDLSYRITLSGFKNYYFPETTIIHYKGESTKKSSINYVFVFYRAMVIFAKKHFSAQNANLFSLLINFAIYLRASAAVLSRMVSQLLLPTIDFFLVLLCFYLFQHGYSNLTGIIFPEKVTGLALLVFPFIWVLINFFSGAYDRPYKLYPVWLGNLYAALAILIIYSLIPEDYRFSRAIILLVLAISFILTPMAKFLMSKLVGKSFKLLILKKKRSAIVGLQNEILRVEELLKESNHDFENLFRISADESRTQGFGFAAHFHQLNEAIKIFEIDEVIFCAKNVSAKQIMETMETLKPYNLEYKIAPSNSHFIIGSNSIHSSGVYYTLLNVNNISQTIHRRNKRLVDVAICLFVLLTFPFMLIINNFNFNFLSNTIKVFGGKISWVGYDPEGDNYLKLPKIKKGILFPSTTVENKNLRSEMVDNLNFNYAKNYKFYRDLQIILRSLDLLGQKLKS